MPSSSGRPPFSAASTDAGKYSAPASWGQKKREPTGPPADALQQRAGAKGQHRQADETLRQLHPARDRLHDEHRENQIDRHHDNLL